MRLSFAAALAAVFGVAQAATVNYNLVITQGITTGDGQNKTSWLINGISPGPLIEATQGDTLNIVVFNQATQNITIHWHGIVQHETPWSDGVPGLTQFPIKPGQSFIYNFVATESGNYWYHSHRHDQLADGFRGDINIRPSQAELSSLASLAISHGFTQSDLGFAFNAEQNPLILNVYDNQHLGADYIFSQWQTTGIEEFCVDDILVNGKGQVICPDLNAIAPLINPLVQPVTARACCPPDNALCQPFGGDPSAVDPRIWFDCQNTTSPFEVFFVSAANKYAVFNIVNTGALYELRFAIDSHTFWVFSVDGAYVQPSLVNVITVPISQRFQILVPLDQTPGDYTIRIASDSIPQLISGFAVFSYKTTVNPSPSQLFPRVLPAAKSPWIDYAANPINNAVSLDPSTIAPYPATPPPQGAADVTINLDLVRQADLNWTMNNQVFTPLPDTFEPLLLQPSGINQLNPALFATYSNGSVVDIILTTTIVSNGSPQPAHPIHKHGPKAWFLGTGTGPFPASTVAAAVAANPGLLNLANPPLLDNFNTLTTFAGQSWAVLRFIADNPMPTFIHCHIDSHLTAGMAFILMEGIDSLPSIPPYYRNFQ